MAPVSYGHRAFLHSHCILINEEGKTMQRVNIAFAKGQAMQTARGLVEEARAKEAMGSQGKCPYKRLTNDLLLDGKKSIDW